MIGFRRRRRRLICPCGTSTTARYDSSRGRWQLLESLSLPASNRDPRAELREQLVQALIGGTFAPSRVQANWDPEPQDGDTVQVKYLANPAAASRAEAAGLSIRPQVRRHNIALAV